jgi:histidinol phosphatase-like enzyme (inositol monophosphatase family)
MEAFTAFAHQLADQAAALTRAGFRTSIAVENKSANHFDPVTKIDREVEADVRASIAAQYPDHHIWGEEFAGVTALAAQNMTWVIDPIDGTRAFISGMPTWGTLIGLYDGDQPVLGIADQPIVGDRFWADATGAFWRHSNTTNALSTRSCASLKDAVIAATSPALFESPAQKTSWQALSDRARLVRWGGDWYNYALLAAGHIDAVIECGLGAYDILPLRPIIEAAGGIVTNWQGQAVTAGGDIVAAGDARLHAEILAQL